MNITRLLKEAVVNMIVLILTILIPTSLFYVGEKNEIKARERVYKECLKETDYIDDCSDVINRKTVGE